MKRFTKLSAVLLILLLLVANIAPAALAAADATVQPGETAKITLDLGNVYGVNGEFSISNEEDFTVTLSGDGVSGKKCYFFSETTEATKLTYTATVVAKASAADGDSCTVTLNYEDWNATGDTATERTVSKTVVVSIPEETKPSEPTKPTEPKPTEPKPTEPKPTEPKPTTPTTPDTPATKPTEPGGKVDYTELNKQIKLANAQTPNDYTDESWAAFLTALENANKATKSDNQAAIDKAAADLAAAIAGLTKMDYTKLEQAIEKAENLLGSSEQTNVFNDLFKGLMEANALLESNSQTDVDAGAKKVEELIAALEKALADLEQGEQTTPTEPTEPAPEGEYCNISIHYVWPILFFISLAVNVVFIILLVLYIVKRKKNEKDNTPLVDYDIGEDA